MKILHLLYESRGDSFGIGGVGERAYQIYSRLKSRHDITLLCKKYPGAKDGHIEGLRHIFVGTESGGLTKTLLSYAYKAAVYVREHPSEYDIIIEEFSPATPTFLHLFTERPLILQVQGYTGLLYFNKYNPLYASALYLLEHIRPRFYRNYIFINKNTREKLHLGPEVNGAIIPNGIQPDLLDLPYREGKYILYLGRIDIYGKGLDILLKAFHHIARTNRSLKLVIAGNGRDMNRFGAMTAELPPDIRSRIETPGWVSGRQKAEVIGDASCLVLPSRHEVQGIAVLEAMSAGKAIIASDIPELSYVPRADAGVCFKSGDPLALAKALADVTSRTDRKQMGVNGRNFVKALSWDRISESFERFVEKTVSPENNPSAVNK
ncbi:MAG: glycosyltransferase family 4 protein [Nitrospirae bacterium]|nr:glycosyltransferase family 4 protein [Nitrospirota bacterium]